MMLSGLFAAKTCLGAIGRDVPWLTKYHLQRNFGQYIGTGNAPTSSVYSTTTYVLTKIASTDTFWQPVRTSFDKSLRISLSPAGTEMVLVRGLLGSDGGREAWRAWQYIENLLLKTITGKEERECWPTRLVLLVSRASLDVDVGPWSSLRQVARSVASREDGWVVPGAGTCNQNQFWQPA